MSSLKLQRTRTIGLSDAEINALVQQNKGIKDQYYDKEYVESLIENLFDGLVSNYFRPDFIGFEDFPERRDEKTPLIYASNHSGMAFPWDAMIFGSGLFKICEARNLRHIKALSAPTLSEIKLMNPYLTPDFWKRVGGIDATSLNFETMMQNEEHDVLIYPEGIPGIGKGFDKRYQLQRFSTSFIRMALKFKTDIVPIFSINGEFINPYSYRSTAINNLVQKIGIPFLPIGILTFLIPFFPWVFYFGMPAKFYFVKGRRIQPSEMIGDKDFEDISEEEIQRITNEVRQLMQEDMDKAVEEYGQKPYQWGDLFKKWKTNLKKFWYFFPPTWHFAFAEHERQYIRYKKTGQPVKMASGLGAIFIWIFKNPFALFFYLPILGFIPLALRGYSNPKKLK
jgi:1-acyl-sn-glycerol-3-phosphate acyltransferase